jgi:hypothetical protein
MASFELAQKVTAIHEGGFQQTASDSGNYLTKADYDARRNIIGTNWGISAPVLAAYLGRTPTVADMKNLKYETALKIYKNQYWDKIKGDKINNQSIANNIYDGSVNQGQGAAFQFTARAMDYDDSPIRLPFPDDLIDLINKGNQEKVFNAIKQARITRYGNTDQGHINRAKSFLFQKAIEISQKSKKYMWPIIGIAAGVAAITTVLIIYFANKKK